MCVLAIMLKDDNPTEKVAKQVCFTRPFGKHWRHLQAIRCYYNRYTIWSHFFFFNEPLLVLSPAVSHTCAWVRRWSACTCSPWSNPSRVSPAPSLSSRLKVLSSSKQKLRTSGGSTPFLHSQEANQSFQGRRPIQYLQCTQSCS